MGPLKEQLAANPQLWDELPIRRIAPGTPHSAMTDIWVRYNDIRPFVEAQDFSKINDPHIPIWYPAYHKLPALKPILFGLMAAVEGEMLGGVLLTRLPPGKGIDKHVDKGWHVGYFDKFAITVSADPGTKFCWEDGHFEPTEGDVWWFDNTTPHWVENDTQAERITLIAAIRTAKFRGTE